MEPVSASGTSLAELQRSSSACSSSSGTAGLIVGRLQLCNFHQMAASLGQCLALSDASATICCLIPCFHCGLLDKTVRVTAWNYVPGFYLGESRGLLEVLCLDPVGTSSLSYAEQTFPSLCVNPGTADARDNILESPLMKVGKKKSVRLVIQGQLMCISPPFSLPQGKRAEEDRVKVEAEAVQGSCQSKQLNLNRLGFLVELVVCRHKPICRCLHHEQENSLMAGTGNTGVCHVYFSQCVACWQPVLSSEFGQCIAITGLRRKSLRVEGGNRCFYVATRTTLVLPATIKSPYGRWQSESPRQGQVHVPADLKHGSFKVYGDETTLGNIMPGALGPRFKSAEMPSTAGKLQCGGWRKKPKGIEPNVSGGCLEQCPVDVDNSDELTSYQGIVTAIFEQNLLVEMDKSVFILLTHVQDLGIATLRAGMTLRAHNVHKVVIRNHWRSCVLLGACSRSHVVVEKFSAVSNPCFIHQPCQNALSKYLGHLTFASAFWILLLTASFSLKFDGAISHEELVGTKKRPGLIQQYLCTGFAVIPTVRRNAVNEFLDHQQCCTFSDVLPTNFGLQVPSISNLLAHMGLLWNDTSSVLWHMRVVTSNLANEVVGTEGRCLRRTISGSELGVILLGCLQVSKTSGKLQLVDGTGAIDVVVPDFHSICSLCKVYEVSQYILVLEGPRSGEFDETGVGGEDRLQLSSSNILKKKVYGKPSLGSLRIFLYFRLQEATHVSHH